MVSGLQAEVLLVWIKNKPIYNPFFFPETSPCDKKCHTTASGGDTKDGREEDSDVEIDLESVEEGDPLDNSDERGEGVYNSVCVHISVGGW